MGRKKMNDKETIIKGLEECMSEGKCSKCVYAEKQATLSCKELLSDIYTLLKEQEAVSVTTDYVDGFGNRTSHCPSCKSRLIWGSNKNYCGDCGQKVTWE